MAYSHVQGLLGGVWITLVPTVLKPLLGARNLNTPLLSGKGLGEEKGLIGHLCFLLFFYFFQSLLHLPTIQIHHSISETEPV